MYTPPNAPRPLQIPKWMIVAGASVAIVLFALFAGLVATAVRQAALKEAAAQEQARARTAELEAAIRTAIDTGNIHEAERLLGEEINLLEAHPTLADRAERERLRQLKTECGAAGSDAAIDSLIVDLTPADYAEYRKTGKINGRKTFNDAGVDAYYARQIAARRDDAPRLRAEAEQQRKDADRAAAAAAKEAEIARKAAEIDRHPLEVKSARWEKGGFGVVGIWHVTIHNRSSRPVGNIAYKTAYFSETGNVVGRNDDVIQKRIEPGQTRTIEINDSFIDDEAHTARFDIEKWDFLE